MNQMITVFKQTIEFLLNKYKRANQLYLKSHRNNFYLIIMIKCKAEIIRI